MTDRAESNAPTANDAERIDRALQRALAAEAYKPLDLHLDRNDGLHIQWSDEHESRYSLAYLRKWCPCATCREQRAEAAPQAATATNARSMSLTVLPANIDRATVFADARLVGQYAMQITWADGHSTGIYDFRYLRAICPCCL